MTPREPRRVRRRAASAPTSWTGAVPDARRTSRRCCAPATRRRWSSPPPARRAPATRATPSSSTGSSTSRPTAATSARSASTAPTTTRARATARPRTRSWPSAATSPPPGWCSSTSRWARTRSSTTSPGYAALLELVRAVARRHGRAGHGLAGRAARGVAGRPAGRRRRLVRAVPGDAHAGAVRAPARGPAVRGARRGAQRGPARRPARGGRPAHRHRRHGGRPRPLHRGHARGRLGAGARHDLRAAGRARRSSDVRPAGDADELLTIAAMRLAMPDRFIPASLDVDGIAGLERRLQAGANVVTSIVPPTVGLAGVSQAELDIDEGYRTVARRAAAPRAAGAAAGRWTSIASDGCGGAPSWVSVVRLLIVGGKLQGTEAAYLAAQGRLGDRARGPPRGAAGGRPRRRATWWPTSPPTTALAKSLVTAVRRRAARLRGRAPRWRGWPSACRPGTCPCSSTSTRTASAQSKLASRRLFDGARRAAAARVAGLRVPGRGQARARPAAARASRWSHDEAELEAARARAGARPATRSWSRSTWPDRRCRSRCSPGAAAPCRCRSPASSSTRSTTAGAWWRRWARPAGQPAAAGPGGACAWDAAVARRRAGRLRRRLRAPRRGPRPERPDGRRGDGRAAPSRSSSRSTRACPARRRRRCTGPAGSTSWSCCPETVRDGAPPRGRPGAAPRLRVPARARLARYAGRPRRARHGRAPAPLRLVPGFFGADEALTDYRPGAPTGRRRSSSPAPTCARRASARPRVVAELARHERSAGRDPDDLQRADEGGAR